MGRSDIRILVVDPDAGYRQLIGDLLTDAGYSFKAKYSGTDALQLISQGECDLLLMETQLGDMDGIQFLQEVHRLDTRLPVIIITGAATVSLAIDAMQYGAFHLVRKPFRMSEIVSVVDKAIKLKKILWRRKASSKRLVSRIELSIPSELEQLEPTVFYLLEMVNSVHPLESSQEMDLAAGLTEALSNAILHGNGKRPELRVYLEMNFHGSALEFIIRDQGNGFDFTDVVDPTTESNLLSDAGRGILMMNWYMDRVEYQGNGNTLRLVKQLL